MLSSVAVSMMLTLIFLAWPRPLSAVTITHLPGFSQETLPFKLETGYIMVDELSGVELFYYFVESETDPSKDPLVLWLSGGPGCSAISGLALEIARLSKFCKATKLSEVTKAFLTINAICEGPLKFKSEEYNGSLPNLEYNPYSWTKFSNIIFVDSPVGAGFSFSHLPEGYETGDKSWSEHTEIFLKKWFIEHVQFLSNPLYIAGDSYAGKVVPLAVHRLSEANDFGMQPPFNIQGYIIGNPSTGDNIDYNSTVPFALGLGIISDELFEIIGRDCKGEDYQYPMNALCVVHIQIFKKFTSEIMMSQVLEPKCALASPKPKYMAGLRSLQEQKSVLSAPEIPDIKCRTYSYYLMYIWANNRTTRDALHVKKGTVDEWQRCNNDLVYTKDIKSSIPYHVNLTTQGYRALVYSGDHDMLVPFVGTKEWIRSLKFSISDQWRSWHVGGQVAGYTESYTNGLTFATVKGAGHTAPEYKSKECFAMFRRWISHRPL